MKQILVIIDGMQDIAYEELGGKTPMSFASCLNKMKLNRRVCNVPDGFEADTLPCVLTMLGVPSGFIPDGRAFVEAAANDIRVGENDLVIRLNTVGVENGKLAKSGINKVLTNELEFPVRYIGHYRHIMVVPNGKEYAATLRTYPPHQNIGRDISDVLSSGNELGEKLKLMSINLLEEHKNMTYLPWNPSVYTRFPEFYELHGCTGAVITQTDAVKGAAILMGMECPDVAGATGDVDTNLPNKLKAALQCCRRHDFVVLHINGADEASHRKNPAEKAAFIQKVDEEVLSPLMEAVPEGFSLIVTSDHASVCETGAHNKTAVEEYLYKEV